MGSKIKMIETKKNWQAKSSRHRRGRKRQINKETEMKGSFFTSVYMHVNTTYTHTHICPT